MLCVEGVYKILLKQMHFTSTQTLLLSRLSFVWRLCVEHLLALRFLQHVTPQNLYTTARERLMARAGTLAVSTSRAG
jgi:hypothetical protein